MTQLGTAEYLQLQLLQLPSNASVLRGTIEVIVNGTQRFQFDIPAQTANGDKIFVRDLSFLRTKLVPASQ